MKVTPIVGGGALALVCVLHGAAAAAQNAPAGSAEFARDLARDYEALSAAEMQQGDHRDALTYELRAKAANAGTPTSPDDVAARQPWLKEKYVGELTEARQRLLSGLAANGALSRAHASAARAQSSYDCWIEQAAEDLQPQDIAACRQSFMTAMTEVESAARQPVADAPPAPPQPMSPAPAAVADTAAPGPARFLVFFDFDKADITGSARDVLDTFRAGYEQHPDAAIVATGHADTAGGDQYNMQLSQRRADAVRNALVRMNVPRDRIEIRARGEAEPLVSTGDGVREPQNRRVEITAQ